MEVEVQGPGGTSDGGEMAGKLRKWTTLHVAFSSLPQFNPNRILASSRNISIPGRWVGGNP